MTKKNYTSTYLAMKVNGKKVDIHRYMMEQHLGRKLLRNEIVHHKNENKHDNRIENLEVMTFKEHNLVHGHTQRLDHDYAPPKQENKIEGMKCKQSKLTDDLVRQLRIEFEHSHKGVSKRAKSLGISHATLLRAINREGWKHIE
jgi:transcriptional regulator with PAS, ATPase and Fis domain